MVAKPVSTTAMGTAFMRAFHAAHDHPKIFDDFLAQFMISAEEYQEREARYLKAFQKYYPDEAAVTPDPQRGLALWMQHLGAPAIVLSRASYNEDKLEEAVRGGGVKQYVILGAGMDTFAFRRPDLVEQLTVFEVDQPDTQAHKRQCLARLGREHPEQLHFIPVDFSRENLGAALKGSSYDPQALSFFSWLGVTYYLSREALLDTFKAVAEVAAPGSSITFDYLDAEAFDPEKAAKRVKILMEMVERVGEPMISGFEPSKLAEDLADAGLRLVEDLGPADIQARFFAGRADRYQASEHAHFAWAVVA
jgi:methyltransferase (TIGR00027 family)